MFETHKLNNEGFMDMELYKNTMAKAVNLAKMMMPESREKSIFITKIEEAVFFGAKAIASKPENFTEIISYPKA